MRLKIRERIVIAYVGLFVLLVLLAGVGLSISTGVSRAIPGSDLESDRVVNLSMLLMLQLPKIGTRAFRGDPAVPADREALMHLLRDAEGKVGALAAQVRRTSAENASSLTSGWRAYRAATMRVFEETDPAARDAIQVTEATAASFAFRERIGDLAETSLLHLSGSTYQMRQRIARGRVLLLTLTSLGLVLCVGFLAALGGLFVEPTRQIVEAIDAIEVDPAAAGVARLRTRSDEIGALAQALDHMIERVRVTRRGEHALMRRLERRSEHAMDCIPDALFICDLTGAILYTNAAARRLASLRDAAPPSIDALPWPVVHRVFQLCADTAKPQVDHDLERAVQVFVDGEEKYYLAGAFPIADEGTALEEVAVLLSDVSYLRQLNEMKVDLIATVSHQLKTPLTSALMSLYLLRGMVPLDRSATEQELIATAVTEAERLRSTIQNLLDMARIQSGAIQMQLTTVDTIPWLEGLADTYCALLAREGIALEVEIDGDLPPLHIDQARLEVVIDNLMTNARKYCRQGDRVTLSAAREADDPPVVVIGVRDTGPGIAPAHMIRLFEKFYRVPNSPQSGAGLGLAIARRIVRAHGGELTCNSTVGQGTMFAIVLYPRGDEEAAGIAAPLSGPDNRADQPAAAARDAT